MKIDNGTIVAIIRGVEPKEIVEIQSALLEGGINWVEVSLSEEEKGLKCIQILHQTFGDSIHLGVGTVTTLDQAKKALEAGATYIITPGWDKELTEEILDLNVDVLPGVFSPGEIMQAAALNIETVKLFPANNLGTNYLNNIKGPFPRMNFMGVGGISLENIQNYHESGCTSFGIGSELVPRGATKADKERIRENAKKYISILTTKG
ncbi:bifunctional 4-hydroxy-2-oxoglutarate aldolase/2-dehydro-3-deoxy-phosphogluconate aldolase [Cytobacillus sp. Hz8]|uniref:bifunctional 4-hydroxy-2-oxoglutarate aldolase/2-dehydro-3-deoxy-phosphogluconate aldolase n=1 Tax=Cytobacillus sp. Hz8 TaxID=3347168 RepID=UPI0035D70BBC